MHQGALAELATGEGKTLTASLPAFLNARTGKGVHVTTVNDYLARRDAEWMRPIYTSLGLTVGDLHSRCPSRHASQAYRCDITYGTASEFGFDFLRDRLKISGDKGQAAPFWGAVAGESAAVQQSAAGSEGAARAQLRPRRRGRQHLHRRSHARRSSSAAPTRPATPEEQVVYHWADQLAQGMERDQHFTLDEKKQKIELTDEGQQLARYSNPPSASTRTPWTSCTSTSNAACRPTTASAAISIT